MKRKLPSMNALRVFEAAARHLSFTRASNELCVTQSAVSRQIRTLEEQLQVKLFERLTRALRLTNAGKKLLKQLQGMFDELEDVIQEVGQFNQSNKGRVRFRLGVDVDIARIWLLPRIKTFEALHPEVDFEFIFSNNILLELSSESVDVEIFYGDGGILTRPAELIKSCHEFIVGSPELLAITPLNTVADLVAHHLLHEIDTGWWNDHLNDIGAVNVDAQKGTIFHDASIVYDQALAGKGLALGDDLLCGDYILSGKMLKPLGFTQPIYKNEGVFLLIDDSKKTDPLVSSFRDWLLTEFEKFEALTAPLREQAPFILNSEPSSNKIDK